MSATSSGVAGPERREVRAALIGRVLAPQQLARHLVIEADEVRLDEAVVGLEQRRHVGPLDQSEAGHHPLAIVAMQRLVHRIPEARMRHHRLDAQIVEPVRARSHDGMRPCRRRAAPTDARRHGDRAGRASARGRSAGALIRSRARLRRTGRRRRPCSAIAAMPPRDQRAASSRIGLRGHRAQPRAGALELLERNLHLVPARATRATRGANASTASARDEHAHAILGDAHATSRSQPLRVGARDRELLHAFAGMRRSASTRSSVGMRRRR